MNIKLTKQQKILYFYVFPGMILLFIFALSLIFSTPNSQKNKEEKITINTSLPGVKSNLKDEKILAYRAEDIRQRNSFSKDESDFVLGDYSVITSSSSEKSTQQPEVNEIEKTNSSPLEIEKQTGKGKTSLYEAKRKLQTEKEALEQFDGDETYDPEAVNTKKRTFSSRKQKLPPKEMNREPEPQTIVSNGVSFNSSTLNRSSINRSNTKGILAYIHGDQVVCSGGYVKIRIGSEIKLPTGHIIPANSFLYGICSLQAERLNIKVTQAEIGSNVLPCNYTVYGLDGNKGLHIRRSVQREENKKGVGRGVQKIGSVLSSGVKIASGGILGDLAETATEGVIDAVADGTSKTATQKDIFLPNNDRIYLK